MSMTWNKTQQLYFHKKIRIVKNRTILEYRTEKEERMEFYAKSKETELSEKEKNRLSEKIETIINDLDEKLTEKEQKIISKEVECLLKQNGKVQKTLKEHLEDIVRRAEDFFSKYGKYFSEFEKKLIIEACRLHDIGKVNIIFQIGVNKELKSKLPSYLSKVLQVPHGFLSAMSISMEKLKEKCNILTSYDFEAFITAVYYHHAREDMWKDTEIKDFAEEYYFPCLEWYLGEQGEASYENINRLMFRNNPNSENMIPNHQQWNEYVLIKGLLNKFDYTVSAGYEEAEIAPDLEKKILKHNIEKIFHGMKLRPAQKYMEKNHDKNLVVIAPTGSGKTEAALLWLNGEKGFYTLPLQVSSNAIYDRIKEKYSFHDVSLLHSDSMKKYLGEYAETEESAYEQYEKAKRLAYPLTVCTVDQLFKFVYKALGTEIFAATLKYSKIILDEIQSYSPKVIATIIYGLKIVTEMGGKFAIITATFPPVLKHFMERYGLVEGEQFEFQDFSDCADSVRHKIVIRDTEIEETEILNAGQVKKVLVICNTVRKAQETYERLSLEMEDVFLLHSRYLRRDREQLEKMIMDFSNTDNRCGIWITTQIVEASLDIDFDILYTEMSTADSLLQRMGRCNRKGRVIPDDPNIIIYANRNGVAENNKGVYEPEIYDRSLEQLRKYENIPFSEQDKIEYINKVYLTEEIKNTNYYKQIERFLAHFNEIPPLEYEKKVADKKFRDIQSVTIVPEKIYSENKIIFDKCIELMQTPHISKEIKNLVRYKMHSLTLNRMCLGNVLPKGVDKQAIGASGRNKGIGIHRAQILYEFDNETGKGRGLVEGEPMKEDIFW